MVYNWVPVVVPAVFLLFLIHWTESAGPIDGYKTYEKKRPKGVKPIKADGLSADLCLGYCQENGLDCSMIAFRLSGSKLGKNRCFLYTSELARSILSGTAAKRRLVDAKVFNTYILNDIAESECVRGTDHSDYRGTVAVTASGKRCQKWTANRPHVPNYRPTDNGGNHNYCRNPDNDTQGVWCYTRDANVRWQYCDVPQCEVAESPCIVCNGRDYEGTVSVTRSGKTCQRWDSDTPHSHMNHPAARPGDNLAENYCRNPDGDLKPWCYTVDETTRWEYCEFEICRDDSGNPIVPEIKNTTACYVGKGNNYRGRVSTTISGRTCMLWSSQTPHAQSNTPENYPCSGLDSNYCRNPSSSYDEGPWCYTTDPTMRWEKCAVPKCGPDGRPQTTTTTTTTTTARTTRPPSPRNCGSPAIEPNVNVQSEVADSRVRILGGSYAVHGSWPWMASIRVTYRPDDSHFCGGTLVDPRWVLTAAHCLDDGTSARLLLIRMGHHVGNEPQAQSRHVLNYYIHEAYSKTKVINDIALIELKSPFVLTDYVMTACLPHPDYIVPGGTKCVISGWGRTFDPSHNDALKEAITTVNDYRTCLRFSHRHMLDRTQMCAGEPNSGQDTCRGDSGGPMSCFDGEAWTVQGVTSWGSSCENKKGSYGAYTRVSKYIDWINGHIDT